MFSVPHLAAALSTQWQRDYGDTGPTPAPLRDEGVRLQRSLLEGWGIAAVVTFIAERTDADERRWVFALIEEDPPSATRAVELRVDQYGDLDARYPGQLFGGEYEETITHDEKLIMRFRHPQLAAPIEYRAPSAGGLARPRAVFRSWSSEPRRPA